MTARQLYEGVLIELNKENAPNILLEDFNYFANKAINNYVNKRYNIYDINQQTTDDLRVLKATALLSPTHVTSYEGLTMAGDNAIATYEVTMPSDYLHILNCICIYRVNRTYKCYNAGDTWRSPATRLTADMYSLVLDNFWNKPTYKRPYYYIHNVNSVNDGSVPTNPYTPNSITYNDEDHTTRNSEDQITGGYQILYKSSCNSLTASEGQLFKVKKDYTTPSEPVESIIGVVSTVGNGKGTDITQAVKTNQNPKDSQHFSYGLDGNNHDIVQGIGLPDTVEINGVGTVSNRERGLAIRYGNVSLVRLEIRYGTDNSVFALDKVYVDYIKAPQNIRLTQQEIDLTEDTSQMLEYPDYVCQEIINELVHLIMENISDQRLQTHPVVSLSIANPAQALAPAQGLSAQ